MEIKLDVDATGRRTGEGSPMYPFAQFAAVPKVKVNSKSGPSRIAALKVNIGCAMRAPRRCQLIFS